MELAKMKDEAEMAVIKELISFLGNMTHEDISRLMPKHGIVTMDAVQSEEGSPEEEAAESPEEEIAEGDSTEPSKPEDMMAKLMKKK